MNKNRIRAIRETLGYTQSDLAEITNLSIRTIQRIESGQSIPKGHTLKVLAEALGLDKIELQQQQVLLESVDAAANSKMMLINLSTLCFIGIPFGNIVIPLWLWTKNKDYPKVNEVGRRIINFQIIWTLSTALLLIISPFLQAYVPADFPLILVVGLLAVITNVFFIIKTARALMRREYDILPLKFRLF